MKETICIVGLGYVGLPLAHAFAKAGYETLGYDIAEKRIGELRRGHDRTRELNEKQLKEVTMTFSADSEILERADIIIMALPTPVDAENKPDLSPVESASKTVGKHLKKGAIVVYESTVYPGTTEEICGPILEKESGLVCGKDFFLGYSPERINPGDKEHTVTKIVKVVAGQDEKTTDVLCELYSSVITAGVHRAPSVKVAEMAKAIENAQRDLNIAFMNEIALLSNKIGIKTKDVLAAAATKWNFLPFKPGLVGGHCIGVDPYYLVEKARQLGMETHVIDAGRQINDRMSKEVAMQVLNALDVSPAKARILVLGLTFKENIPDTRNSKSMDVVHHLQSAGCAVEVNDPYVSDEELKRMEMTTGACEENRYDAVVFLAPHREYLADVQGMINAVKKGGVFYDLKSLVDRDTIERAGRRYVAL
ncbi:nucleotide sugar dehydrogenase [Candidatus Peregrinibacteria bacterium]|nr:nucleotide sugar dehydrogenase [Candidatus Peregrinibacteria bacterium]MBI3816809.1 nucleotide sugar dehydrogenase [Candidatus Peregrinibacteria bacterium]